MPPKRTASSVSPTRRKRARQPAPSRLGFLTVGQTARILGVSASTLRMWESVGLIAPVRSNGQYRLYSPELLKVLKRIKYLREVQHVNVPGIKRELGPAAGSRASKEPRPLGPKLKKLRARTGFPLADAAKRAGISTGFLSSVERGQANASLATLQRLAAAYGTTVMDLFQAPKGRERLVRPADRRVLEMHSGVRMEMLSSGATMLQSMLFRVAPLSGSDGSYSHQGEEFLYMLDGQLEIWLDELECFVLSQGDGFWFESTLGHRWFNPGEVDAVLLWINTPPTF